MNAERLLELYDRVAEAPDAVARLRRFVLDLAVRGKLVEQDPVAEPASELLKKISGEKELLLREGRIKKLKPPAAIEDVPFSLPTGWLWVRLSQVVTKLTDGTHHSPPNGRSGDFKYVTAKNIKEEGVSLNDISYVSRSVHDEIYSRCNPEIGDILYIKDGATTGVVALNDLEEPFSMLSSVALLKMPSCVFNRAVLYFLRSPFFYDQMRGFMKGAAITRVTLKRMAPALFPLPPLAEQHRIVEKVDELMALCDRLEEARTTREATRDRLTTASLARLTAPDTDERTFRSHARFALDAFPALTTRPDQIKALRQTILNLAVRGKLVEQDPADEPASELWNRIQEEKRNPAPPTRGKEQISAPAVMQDAGSGSAPRGWCRVKLGSVIHLLSGQHLQKAEYSQHPKAGIPYVTGPADFSEKGLLVRRYALVHKSVARQGQLLVTVKGSGVGKSTVCDLPEVAISRQLMALTPVEWEVKYLNLVTYGLATKLQAQARSLIPGISRRDVEEFVFDFPPLEEQHRIVEKVDELMALCDRLEQNLATRDAVRGRLLESLLREALAPVDAKREVA